MKRQSLHSIDEFTRELKTFIDYVRNMDPTVIEDVKQIIEDLNMSLTLFIKFNEIWQILKIRDRYLNKDNEVKIKKIAWLIFITAKGILRFWLTFYS